MEQVTVSFMLDIARLASLQAFLAGDIAESGDVAKAPGKRGRPKAEAAPEETVEEDVEFNFEEEETAPTTITLAVIRQQIKKVMDAGKSAALGKLFAAFKVKNASGIPESKYEKFYENLMKIKV